MASDHPSVDLVMPSPERGVPLLLTADIGGTNARFALWLGDELLVSHSYPTKDYQSLDVPLSQFLSEHQAHLELPVEAACFGVAGPVFEGSAHLTNVGWSLNERSIAALLRCPVSLVNDFFAQAAVVTSLSREQVVHLCGPESIEEGAERRPIAVLGAGTGLGEAFLIPECWARVQDEPRYRAFATEGGHTRFAPRNEVEVGLMRWLQGRYGEHVSVERILSGPGLVDLFNYLRGGQPLSARYQEPVTPEQVTAAAEQRDELALRALQRWVELYADEAANLALKLNAEAIYLSGGLSPKLLPALRASFPGTFVQKGRYRPWLSSLSVWVVTAEEPGLLGARQIAADLAQSARQERASSSAQ